MKIKDLALKQPYFDQIAKGSKKTEYRTLVGSTGCYYVNTFLNADSYTGKSAEDIRKGLLDGSIKELRPSGITHIRFHNLGRVLLVEVKDLRVDKSSKVLCIELGKVLTGRAAKL